MKYFFILISAMCCFQACTQSRLIPKAYSFSQNRIPGTIAVDENGKPLAAGPQTSVFIYLETTGNSRPKITEVRYKKKIYTDVTLSYLGNKPIEVGKQQDNTFVIITPAKGKYLWKIEFTANPGNEKISSNVLTDDADIPLHEKVIIIGVSNKTKFSITTSEVQLKTMEGL